MSEAFAGLGTELQLGDGASPEVFDTIAEIVTLSRSGSKADYVDVTNMDSVGGYREFLVTLLDAGEINFTANFIPNDATQEAVRTQFESRAVANWKIVLPNSLGTFAFAGFVTAAGDESLDFDKQGVVSGKIKITGAFELSA